MAAADTHQQKQLSLEDLHKQHPLLLFSATMPQIVLFFIARSYIASSCCTSCSSLQLYAHVSRIPFSVFLSTFLCELYSGKPLPDPVFKRHRRILQKRNRVSYERLFSQ